MELQEDKEIHLARLKRFATWLDDRIPIPGTDQRVGLDAIIGFIPVVGDVFTSVTALYILREAWRLGVPKTILMRMMWNVGIDFILGAVPVVGDLYDVYLKSNLKNVQLLIEYLEREFEPDTSICNHHEP
ncbi:MAG: hypothetical protein CMH81_00185 [Nitrospiraceae bacterium]|jgi:hypothetical protein|nr:hypothetical protein [Nitrospiraceae bacterium]|tara:strand:+ start:1698 stop:2087 length:390 start_codon:yes stop_codon:yes gene_type:complete